MQRLLATLSLAVSVLAGTGGAPALESAPAERPGIRSVRLVTAAAAVVPGETLTVGLRLDPLPGHHTYWRGPGIVGVATRLDWTLPEGFTAGEILWPPPERVLMAGIDANGFRREVLLLVDIETPEVIAEKEVVLSARATWMACAVSCNPGLADLSLTLPVAKKGASPPCDEALAAAFAKARALVPGRAPAEWGPVPRLAAPDRIEVDLTVPGFDPARGLPVRFFCDDMQVDSHQAQRTEILDAAAGTIRLILSRPEFAPKNPAALSGVLQSAADWPGTGSPFIEISAPWPQGTFPP